MGRLSVAEQESLAAARAKHPDMPQRELARQMYIFTNDGQVGHILRFRSKATIYGAIRRLDKKVAKALHKFRTADPQESLAGV